MADDNELLALVDEGVKSGTVAAIGTFPVIGGIAAAFLSKMYANDDEKKKEDKLKAMEERQKQYSRNLVDQSNLDRVRAVVSGKSGVVKNYVDAHAPGKGNRLGYLCDSLTDDHDQVYNVNANPEHFYMEYLAYATLHLGALRDQAYYWNQAYFDPTTKKLSSPNNDFDLHVKQLFDWQAKYVTDLENIRNRLMAWRMNNISGGANEEFHQYPTGDGSWDAYYGYEWHDTITGLKYYIDTLHAGFTEENAKGHRQTTAQNALNNYRSGMYDERNKTFQHEGQTIDSYAYHLAHEMAVASRWKYFCLPQGGAPKPEFWMPLSFARVDNKLVLNYAISRDYARIDAPPPLQFPIQDCLPGIGFTEQLFPGWRDKNWAGFEDNVEWNGTGVKSFGSPPWSMDFATQGHLYVVDGELRFIDRTPKEWTWGLD